MHSIGGDPRLPKRPESHGSGEKEGVNVTTEGGYSGFTWWVDPDRDTWSPVLPCLQWPLTASGSGFVVSSCLWAVLLLIGADFRWAF